MAGKTFEEKLNDNKDFPKIVQLSDPKQIHRYGGTRMLIAPPLAYDTLMKKVPSGKVTTTEIIRNKLADRYNADFTCPLTAGIFINIAAGASYERASNKTPYWRTLKKDGELNGKYPEGVEGQKILLELEGHEVIKKGKRYFVKDFEKKICEL